MKVSYGLPAHRVDLGEELCSAEGLTALARAAESAGFDAVYLTEHPFPTDEWLAQGGHHALDPLVALAAVAGSTERLRLHTHLFIPAYRNPYLAAKSIATLDLMSAGRLILGVGTGYLAGEFEALGARFEGRNDATDAALQAMIAAWSGESVGEPGNTMLPRPVQRPHPPIWVGGNSGRAMQRAVELGDGWAPFSLAPKYASSARSAAIGTTDDLAAKVRELNDRAAEHGRTAPLDVCFSAPGLDMMTRSTPSASELIDLCGELARAGVTWVTAAFPPASRSGQLEAIEAFGTAVLHHLRDL